LRVRILRRRNIREPRKLLLLLLRMRVVHGRIAIIGCVRRRALLLLLLLLLLLCWRLRHCCTCAGKMENEMCLRGVAKRHAAICGHDAASTNPLNTRTISKAKPQQKKTPLPPERWTQALLAHIQEQHGSGRIAGSRNSQLKLTLRCKKTKQSCHDARKRGLQTLTHGRQTTATQIHQILPVAQRGRFTPTLESRATLRTIE
jgi:hypothetical protein